MSVEPLELRAGSVRLELEGPDLRALGPEGEPLVQRVYPAFRDAEWGTAPVLVAARRVERAAESFAVELRGTARLGELEVGWRVRAEGDEEGAVGCRFEAEARTGFEARRIGLCVHLDAEACIGADAIARAPDSREERTLTDLIAPQPLEGGTYLPMLGPFTSLSLTLADGTVLVLDTAGSPFELEDQRNWADGSLKAYSSGVPGAHRFEPGERVEQEVRLAFAAPPRPRPRRRPEPLEIGAPGPRSVVPIGLAAAPGWEPPEGLAPAHLRVDAGFGEPLRFDPESLAATLQRTGAEVELAVHGAAGEEPRLPGELVGLPLARVLALERSERSTSPELARFVREAVGAEPPLAAGTSAHFSEVCRRPPEVEEAELLTWSAHPQVHADDERSVIENLPGLGAQVRTARALRPALCPLVSALRLGPPGRAEPRACTAFGGAWAVGALAQLLGAGVESVTLGAEGDQEAPLSVAAVLMDARGAPLRPLTGLERGFAAIAWGAGEPDALIANLTPASRDLTLRLPDAEPLVLRLGPYEWIRLSSCL